MKAKSRDEILGFEFDWIASDADGHVGFFSTAGGGYAPDEFLRDTEAHDAAIESVLTLGASTRARFAPEIPSNLPNTWQLVAERGLFAFDSDPNGGPYRKVAAPEVPVRVSDLPEAVASVAERLVYPRLRFSELQEASEDLLAQSP